ISVTVAVNRPFKNQKGENEADFINCVTWRKQAENLANYMKKGSQIGVDGRIQTRNYDNQEGKRVFVTEVLAENIQFLEPRSQTQQRPSSYGQSQNQNYQQNQTQSSNYNQNNQDSNQSSGSNPFEGEGERITISDDDLPF